MRTLESGRFVSIAALLAVTLVAGCGDDSDANDEGASTGLGTGTSTSTSSTGVGTSTSSSGTTDLATSGTATTTTSGTETTSDGSGESGSGGPMGPELPPALSLSGCTSAGLGPLCSVEQDETRFSANCGGVVYSGEIADDGAVTFGADDWTTEDGATASTNCTGTYRLGLLQASCTVSTSATEETAAGETTCDVVSDRTFLPSVECMELPSLLADVVICAEGDAGGGTTIDAGMCDVIQDGCMFQAECENDVVLVGSVGQTDLSFEQVLTALADAETPEEGEPEFLVGAQVEHDCSATVDGTSLSGSCAAGGAGRRGTDTSVCAISGSVEAVPQCGNVSPIGHEQLFTLDSCELLKEGETPGQGIGEPVCAFRQNNCIWDLQCGMSPSTHFSGRLEPGATSASWRLATGTPCEIAFDENGGMSGSCTVPGQEPCQLSDMPPSPGGEDCPALPEGTDHWARGCGDRGGTALACRSAMQHGCNYMATCAFTSRFPNSLLAGVTSYDDGRGHFDFTGVNGYTCAVDEATAAEIASGDRLENEWYGQCTNADGGQCRDNYDPETGEGFRGMQLFFSPMPEDDSDSEGESDSVGDTDTEGDTDVGDTDGGSDGSTGGGSTGDDSTSDGSTGGTGGSTGV